MLGKRTNYNNYNEMADTDSTGSMRLLAVFWTLGVWRVRWAEEDRSPGQVFSDVCRAASCQISSPPPSPWWPETLGSGWLFSCWVWDSSWWPTARETFPPAATTRGNECCRSRQVCVIWFSDEKLFRFQFDQKLFVLSFALSITMLGQGFPPSSMLESIMSAF